MAPTEIIFITHAGKFSEHTAEIDPSKSCAIITTAVLKRHGLSELDKEDEGDEHSEMHHGDGFKRRIQIRARSELVPRWTITSFCLVESDAEVIVLNKPLNPKHTEVPRSAILTMANNSGTLTSATQSQIQANNLAGRQAAATGIQNITEAEIKRRKALDEEKKKRQQQQKKT